MVNPEDFDFVSVSAKEASPDGAYLYTAIRRNGKKDHLLTSKRRSYKWFHQWRYEGALGETKIVYYFSTKQRAAPVPAWVPGRAVRLEPLAIVYL